MSYNQSTAHPPIRWFVILHPLKKITIINSSVKKKSFSDLFDTEKEVQSLLIISKLFACKMIHGQLMIFLAKWNFLEAKIYFRYYKFIKINFSWNENCFMWSIRLHLRIWFFWTKNHFAQINVSDIHLPPFLFFKIFSLLFK